MDYIINIVTGSAGGAVLVWLAKGWFSERLKQSITHEYAAKLESYKIELNYKIESIKHENQVSQLRTSLFFDHQRNAFAALITKISKLNDEWMNSYDPDDGLYSPVPFEGYKELEILLSQHQLFLDEECIIAMSLIMNAYQRSFPYDDRTGAPPHQGDSRPHLSYIEYLQPRIASIFRSKIGIESDRQHLYDVAILSAIELVNNYHFSDIQMPPKGVLSTMGIENASEKVLIGMKNIRELKALLQKFDSHLTINNGWFHEAHLAVKQTMKILDKLPAD